MSLEQRIAAIESRNNHVGLDKKWEVSWERRSLILVLTYAIVVVYFIIIDVSNPLLNAVVPTLGFYLSTLTVGFAKKYWIKKHS